MSTVLAPTAPLDTHSSQAWRLTPSSHLAVALHRHAVASPVPVLGGTFTVDPASGIGSLSITLALPGGGAVRGFVTRGARDGHGVTLWSVRGTLEVAGRSTPVILALRDHGVTRLRSTWWWLSGTGDEDPCPRRPRHGSRLVADLLLAP